MQTLRKIIIKEWITTVNDKISVIDLTNKHYKQLFWLYDKLVFNNQIITKFNEINAHYTYDTNFSTKKNDHSKHKRICDVSYIIHENSKHTINIIVQPWIISRIINCKLKDRKEIFGSTNELECILITFEHQIAHVLELLWNIDILEKSPFDEIYGTHGKVYNCATNIFFDDNVVNLLNKLSDHIYIPKPLIFNQYKYWSNSCSLDTLTMTLLTCKSDFFRNVIFTTNSSLTNYNFNSRRGLKFDSICSTITSEDNFKNLVSQIQSTLFDDYNKMLSKNNNVVTCSKLRNLLLKCYDDMKVKNQWVTYNVSELYSLYCVMFPDLSTGIIPIKKLISGSNIVIDMMFDHYEIGFSFWDFIHDAEIEDNNYVNIYDWDNFNQEILVFKNGGIPAITNFGTTNAENVNVITYKNNKPQTIKTKIVKSRKFGETIINNKYEMVGAIILEGTKPGKDSGTHYYSYINTLDGWIMFNDIGPKWEKLDEFPKNVLVEQNGKKPEMYFYRRI